KLLVYRRRLTNGRAWRPTVLSVATIAVVFNAGSFRTGHFLPLNREPITFASVMALPQTSRRVTEAEYLQIERAAEFKSEFFDGEIFAMAGGTPQHNLLRNNATREGGNRLEKSHCVAFNADLIIKIDASL